MEKYDLIIVGAGPAGIFMPTCWMASTGTRPHTAAAAASRFSMLCRPRSFTSF